MVDLAKFTPPPRPQDLVLTGDRVRLEPLGLDHAAALHAAFSVPEAETNWRYLPYGPFGDLADFSIWLSSIVNKDDPYFLAIVDANINAPIGVASLMRIAPEAGSIEVGHIHYSPALQRTVMATEAMHLLMRWVFAAGYRRYEWKCDALNAPSRRAAQRLGFSFEGIFRQAAIVKGRNRDTAWFAVIDAEWPALDAVFQSYLAADNFDENGRARQSLGDLTRPLLFKTDPDF